MTDPDKRRTEGGMLKTVSLGLALGLLIVAAIGGILSLYGMRDAVDEATIATAYACGYLDGYTTAGKELTGMEPEKNTSCDRERGFARKHSFGFAPEPHIAISPPVGIGRGE